MLAMRNQIQNPWGMSNRSNVILWCWLPNSIIPKLANAFFYANSAKEIYNKLTEKFDQSNRPLLYHIQNEIEDLYNNNDTIVAYYTKLKTLGMS